MILRSVNARKRSPSQIVIRLLDVHPQASFVQSSFSLFKYDLARHRGSVEAFLSGLGVIPKVLQINDALYRPLYFVFEALLRDQ